MKFFFVTSIQTARRFICKDNRRAVYQEAPDMNAGIITFSNAVNSGNN